MRGTRFRLLLKDYLYCLCGVLVGYIVACGASSKEQFISVHDKWLVLVTCLPAREPKRNACSCCRVFFQSTKTWTCRFGHLVASTWPSSCTPTSSFAMRLCVRTALPTSGAVKEHVYSPCQLICRDSTPLIFLFCSLIFLYSLSKFVLFINDVEATYPRPVV